MPINKNLKQSLNKIREISSDIYHMYVPVIEDDTDISVFANPILTNSDVRNEFCSALICRIAYTGFTTKYFTNPLQVLEGDNMPLGAIGQDIYVNPSKGRQFNGEDFAGLLAKYEADVKVQYFPLNMDKQYPVTISRQQLRTAFTSWEDLGTFIENIINSLYNGAYIDSFNYTKYIVSSAYKDNKGVIEQISGVSSEALAKEFVAKARTMFLNFQTPQSKFNAWAKCGGSSRPITTWSDPEEIVFLVRNDIRSYLDVNVLASSFNVESSKLLGRILPVDNFDVYDDDGNKIFDGSKIVGCICDASWFKIKQQDMFMDTFYNPNNRTTQYYLNLIKSYNFSLFANGVIFATEIPEVTIAEISTSVEEIEVKVGETATLEVTTNPITANNPTITYTSADTTKFTVEADANNNKKCVITGVATGTKNLTISAGQVTKTVSVKVVA